MPKYQYVSRKVVTGFSAMLGFIFPAYLSAVAPVTNKVLEHDLGEKIDEMESIIPVMERAKAIDIALPYFNRYPQFTEQLLGRAVLYFPVIEKVLKKYNLPEDLKYIPFFESGFRDMAVSPVGATGLWQFMEGTGKKFGLTINRELDERLDFVKSTDAAARFLKSLHEELGSWALVLMAYNGGQYRVKRLIRENNTSDIQVIMEQMPRESQAYLSKMIAAKLIFKSYKYYGLVPRLPDPVDFYSIQTSYITSLDLKAISKEYQVDYTALRQANPHLKYQEINNPGHHSINIRIPVLAKKEDGESHFRNQIFYITSEDQLDDLASMLKISPRKIELVNGYFDPVNLTGEIIRLQVPLSQYMVLDKTFGPPPANFLRKNLKMIVNENLSSRIIPISSRDEKIHITRKLYYLRPAESLLDVASRLNIPLEQIKNMNPNMDLYQSRRFYIPIPKPQPVDVVGAAL